MVRRDPRPACETKLAYLSWTYDTRGDGSSWRQKASYALLGMDTMIVQKIIRVRLTRHGVVFSESPSSEKVAASRGLCSTCAPTSTFTSSPSTNVTVSERGSPSAGAIAGAATAAAIIIIIIIILSIGKSELMLVFVLRRRKKHRPSCDTSEAETLGSDSGATGSEKLNSLKDAFSRMSKDPFAPFGGRVDKPDYPYRPSTGTFELDGVAITVVELPATSVPEVSGPVNMAATALDKASKPDTVKTAAAAPDEASDPDIVKTAPDEASDPDIVKTAATASGEVSEPNTVKAAAAAPDEASEPDIVKTASDEASEPETVKTVPDEASELDTVKAVAAVSDEVSEPDAVKTVSDEYFEPDTVKTALGEASEPDTVDTAAKAPYEASDLDIVKTAARAPDKASEPRTAPPTPEPAATLASPSSPQGKIAYNIDTKADDGANAESFDRTGLSSIKESHTKQKQLALERKANKPLAEEVQRRQVTSDLSVHVGILYLRGLGLDDDCFATNTTIHQLIFSNPLKPQHRKHATAARFAHLAEQQGTRIGEGGKAVISILATLSLLVVSSAGFTEESQSREFVQA
ncbi:hypothetical protein E4U31_002263 [Claviceps sp. LM219 group G6]|nr:hypothetical protein E4U31_002263 [Claviceps sp. LM219 group G6]